MKKKISALTIILILLSLYLINLSYQEYRATKVVRDLCDEDFERYLSETSSDWLLGNYTPEEFKIAQNENTIEKIQNKIDNNWCLDNWISRGERAKDNTLLTLVVILLTILSWRFDNLKKKA